MKTVILACLIFIGCKPTIHVTAETGEVDKLLRCVQALKDAGKFEAADKLKNEFDKIKINATTRLAEIESAEGKGTMTSAQIEQAHRDLAKHNAEEDNHLTTSYCNVEL